MLVGCHSQILHVGEADSKPLVSDNRRMVVCSRCGMEIPLEARFCPGCGAPVAEERLFAGLDAEERAQLHRLLAKVADSSGILAGCAQLIEPAE